MIFSCCECILFYLLNCKKVLFCDINNVNTLNITSTNASFEYACHAINFRTAHTGKQATWFYTFSISGSSLDEIMFLQSAVLSSDGLLRAAFELIFCFHADEYFKAVRLSGKCAADLRSAETLWRSHRWRSYTLLSAETARGVGKYQPCSLPAVPLPKTSLII